MKSFWRTFTTVFRKELRELLRDRRTLFLLFAPPLLTPLFGVFAGSLILFQVVQQLRDGVPVAVINTQAAPALVEQLRADPTLRLVEVPHDPEAALRSGQVLVVLTIPDDFEARIARQEQVTVTLRSTQGYWLASLVRGAVEGVVQRYSAALRDQRLAEQGLDQGWLEPLVIAEAPPPQAPPGTPGTPGGPGGVLAPPPTAAVSPFSAVFFPLAIASWALSGGLGLIIESTVGEKEGRTLAALLATSASRTGIALGKLALAVGVSGVVMSTWVLDGLIILAALGWLPDTIGSLGIALPFEAELAAAGELRSFGWTAVVLAVLVIPFVTSLSAWVMVLCTLARSYRESGLLVLLLELGFPGIALLAAFGIGLNPPWVLYLTPLLGTILAVRDLFQGGLAPLHLGLSLVASLFYAVLGVWVAGWVFSKEWALMRGT